MSDTISPIDTDPYARGDEENVDRVYTAAGGDWSEISAEHADSDDQTVVINMGPQHPSTHGVLRLMLELDGETIQNLRAGIGYLHTGIEKNMEFRSWTQGSTFVTRMDYVAPLFNEAAYSMSVERLLGIEDEIPERTQVIRVLMMELCRIASHLVCIATGGMEAGALTVMTIGFREREMILDFFEAVTGLRMNHGYIRPGGVSTDLPDNALAQLKEVIAWLKKRLPEYAKFCNENPIFKGRMKGVGHMDLATCMAFGVTGPPLRSTGYDWDLRRKQPYCGYEDYDFEVVTWDEPDAYGRFRIRLEEINQSLHIVEQCAERLAATEGQSIRVDDPKLAWPAELTVGADGQGNSNEHLRHIMGESMEALIHHFKLVTEGFKVPAGQAYVPIESPKGELGAHVVSSGGTNPYRVHMRDPGFNHLQTLPVMGEGGMISDLVLAIGSIDPVMGGVDR
ncbi:NADH-quinone oxidoreductase subunit D [Parenemella sanctibonifatiensis]|uniref:NADH-quinone oxidoreductase subunit D n=1 Tax=Parenemella sanctibonifatiensis TaxID=2016505 RepID=A0A255ELE9_9ACTN|nr:NADH-quinone oxidoreductase subunit D [Parenemella sanctibonifatiensis]OYN88963.1 NADH dehydrogenase subunit D [Parenemella sanctibonifatiensis]